jgi:5-formyltetrahydrofolate cyclo-ligase
MPSSSDVQRDELRQRLRAARRALTPSQRNAASLRAAAHLLAHPWYRRARHVALYWPIGSETDTTALLAAALRDGKRIALPAIVCRQGRLLFVRFRGGTGLSHRRHGIPQPRPADSGDRLRTRALDLVLVPLLGFDRNGHRLGSGAGYYDRSFAFRKSIPHSRPRLVGLAFECQRTRDLKPGGWDVPLDAVVTESGWFFPESARNA